MGRMKGLGRDGGAARVSGTGARQPLGCGFREDPGLFLGGRQHRPDVPAPRPELERLGARQVEKDRRRFVLVAGHVVVTDRREGSVDGRCWRATTTARRAMTTTAAAAIRKTAESEVTRWRAPAPKAASP